MNSENMFVLWEVLRSFAAISIAIIHRALFCDQRHFRAYDDFIAFALERTEDAAQEPRDAPQHRRNKERSGR